MEKVNSTSKKILSIILAIVLTFSLAQASVFASTASSITHSTPYIDNRYVTDTTAVVTGSLTNPQNEALTRLYIQYSKHPDFLPSDTREVSVSTSYTFNLKDLEPDTRYWIKVVSVSTVNTAGGQVVESPTNSFTTLKKQLNASVTIDTPTVKFLDTNRAEAKSYFNVTNGTIRQAGFVWSTSTNVSLTNRDGSTTTITQGSNSANLNDTITGLSDGKTYYVKAYVILNENDTPYYSTNYVTYTNYNSNAPKVTIDTPTVEFYDTNRATAKSYLNVTNGTISRAGFVWSTSTNVSLTNKDDYTTTITQSSNSANLNDTITGLSDGRTYYVKAYAILSENDTPYYSTNYATYTNYNSDAPQVTTEYPTYSDGRIYLKGIITNDNNRNITARGFVYSYSRENPTLSDSSIKVTSSSYTFTDNFTPSSGYNQIYVRAYATSNAGTNYGTSRKLDLQTQKPSISTTSVDNITVSSAEVSINVSSTGTSTLIERGVVYSKTGNSPTIDGNNCIVKTITGTTGTGSIILEDLEKSTTYYVCAYAKNSYGTSYGEVRQFTTTTEDIITTTAITEVTNTSAITGGTISKNLDYVVKNRGIVYSKTNTVPIMENSEYIEDPTADSGTFTTNLKDLTNNTKYYVRAYFRTTQGYTYGNVRSFTTSENALVKTNTITEIKNKEAKVNAYVENDSDYTVTERGVVYSKTDDNPTVTNSETKTDSTTTTGDFSIVLTGLESNTRYYVRAYAKTRSGYTYGNVKQFTTINNYEITVNFKQADQTLVGSTTLTLAPDTALTMDMIVFPEGFTYIGTGFTPHNITDNETITITVKPIVSPDPIVQDSEFISGTGNYMFSPNVAITRLDVAKMIYNLQGKGQSFTGKSFTDIPANHVDIQAINYVSYMNYMSGYPDNSFKPLDSMTRAEVARTICAVFSLTPNVAANKQFTDISTHWANSYILIAAQNGIISGYAETNGTFTFKPQNTMTRADATILFSRSSNRTLIPLGTASFIDVPTTHYAYQYIMNASIAKP